MPFGIALAAASYVLLRGTSDAEASDFDQLWHGARAVFHGADPYTYVGPQGVFAWDHLYYPLPAVLLVSPLALMPLLAARACFAAISAGLLAAALVRDAPVRLLMFLSAPTLIAIGRGQWSPLLVAASYFPWLAWIGVAKPNIALAVLFGCKRPRSAIVAALIGGGVLIAAAFLVDPGWMTSWFEVMRRKGDSTPVILRGVGGVFLLAALLRWRRSESRLVVALGTVPQTPSLYDAVPLFTVPRGFRETAMLATAGNLALLLLVVGPGLATEEIGSLYADRVMLWSLICLFLPATLMILRRPNDPDADQPANQSKGKRDAVLVMVTVLSTFFAGWAMLTRFL